MYFTTHALVGAAAGLTVKNWLLAVIVGLLSHIGLDMVPHHDYHQVRYGVVDVLIGSTLLFILAGRNPGLPVFLAGVAGGIPDLELVIGEVYGFLKQKSWHNIFPSHTGLVRHRTITGPWGFVTQAAFALAGLLFLIR
ncbi:MAG: hypothetical protein ACM3TT_06830 [Syntrophothermus sp.]